MSGENGLSINSIDVLDLQLPLGKIKISCSLNPLTYKTTCETNQDGNPGPTYDISVSNSPMNNNEVPMNNNVVQELNCNPYGQMAGLDVNNNAVCMPVTCPRGSYENTDSLGFMGCSLNSDSNVVICPYGYAYDIKRGVLSADGNNMSRDMISCMGPIPGLPGKLGNTCPPGYQSTNANSIDGSPKCVYVATFTSNVYDFKSKKERRIENFSENGKCKTRY